MSPTLKEDVKKTGSSGGLNFVFPEAFILPLSHVSDLDLDLDPSREWRLEKGGVVSSCLPHFLPSTQALIGNLGGLVYLHG